MPKKPAKKPRAIPRHDHFITTVPVIRPCRSCGVWLAAGIAEGLHAESELTPLDFGQQLQAILIRLPLYNISRTGLVEMDQSRLQAPRGAVYPGHRCGIRWECRIIGAGISRKSQPTGLPF